MKTLATDKRTRIADILLCAVLAIGVGLLTYAFFAGALELSTSDVTLHASWATEVSFANPEAILQHIVHFFWHLQVAALLSLGVSLETAACLVSALWKVAYFLLLRYWFAKETPLSKPSLAPTLWALVCVTVSVLRVPHIGGSGYVAIIRLPDGARVADIYGSPNPMHSPTQIVSMVMALLVMLCLVSLLREFEQAEKTFHVTPPPPKKPFFHGVGHCCWRACCS